MTAFLKIYPIPKIRNIPIYRHAYSIATYRITTPVSWYVSYRQILANTQPCTQTLFHTRHSREMQEIFKHNNKRQYFIEPFLIRCVRCKHKHFWRLFLSSPLVLSRLTTAVVVFLSGSGSRYAIKFLIWGCITSILAPNITTRWY